METPEVEYRVVRKDHFDWIHRESLRLGAMARDYHVQSVELLAEVVRLKTELERLTKAVMHSPAAQLKLKELEGKNTYEEINPKEDENARLKAEVERLEKEVWRMKVFKGIDEDTKATLKDALNTVPEWAKVLETEAENARLKAELERITKNNETAPPTDGN